VEDWSKNFTAKSIAALTKGETYYFNIAVRDSKGNRAAYQRAVVDPLNVVYLFSTGSSTYQGNLGGRAGADAKCQACYDANYTSLNCTSVRALISVNGTDSVINMPSYQLVPSNVEIHGSTGKRIGKNWADILDGSIEITLAAADVQSSGNYWTGSNSNGGESTYTCTNWTVTGNPLDLGIGGSPDNTTGGWLTWGVGGGGILVACADYHQILCVCWQ